MAIMKTLTVGSETYTVRDPEAVSFEQPQALTPMQQQTARGNIGATSVRETVDKLCPRFDESGSVVICEPVAGHPLEVVSHLNRNPDLLADIWDTTKWGENPMGWMTYETDLPRGEYIIYAEFDSQQAFTFVVDDYDEEEGQWKGFELHSGIPKAFTHSGGMLRITDEYLTFKAGKVTQFKLKEYTVCTSVRLTQCGKNLIDPVKIMEANDDRTTLNADVFTTNFISGGIHLNYNFDRRVYFPKGTYTFTFIPLTAGATASLFVYLRDKTSVVSNKLLDANNPSCTFTAEEDFAPCLSGSVYGTYSYKIQLEAGNTATPYEPYRGETFTAEFDPALGPIYGGAFNWTTGELTNFSGDTYKMTTQEISALPGVNTLYSDTGETWVAGRADLKAIAEKLTKAIISLGGNI